jgi:hypothetical protein
MTNKLITELERYKVADSENISLISKYLDQAEVTFFSWKMFNYWLEGKNLKFNFNFDTEEADKFIQKEKYVIKTLKESGVNFKYVKLVPDELIYYFFDVDVSAEAERFRQQVEEYFGKYYKNTKAILFSNFVKKNQKMYDEIFYKAMDIKVDKQKFKKETQIRFGSKELAQKAFALFTAEANLVMKMSSTNELPNAILLAGERSIDTYKYEFFKVPANRPTIPKMFVI